jgi:two-component system phosphate regulon sensor histidine kinase PhoR
MLASILLAVLLCVLLLAWGRERARRISEASGHAEALIAERIRCEAELRTRAERTDALFDRMVEGLIVTDASGRIRLANRAAGSFFDFALPAAGKTLLEATRRHEIAEVAERLSRQPEVLGQEIRLEGAGAVRFVQINALALTDGAMFVFHDLTRLRQLEAVRQEFVANVSHELRTPLSLIKSAAETLLDGGREDPATLVRFLEIIDRHANRLTLLIDDLLLLSTLDSGRVRLQLQPVGLRGASQEVIDDFQVRARARSVILTNQVASELVARADPDRLRQVLSNLVDNAIKYGKPAGKVVVSGSRLSDGLLEISVRDDGPGLPHEARGRIFERFFRVDKARSREQGGTGLGLAIVKHVVQAHGGEVRLVSEPGAGATFSFTLPAAVDSEEGD